MPEEVAKNVELMENVLNSYPLPSLHFDESSRTGKNAEEATDGYQQAPITMDQIDMLRVLLKRHVQLLLQQAVLAMRDDGAASSPNVKGRPNQAKNTTNDPKNAMTSSIVLLSKLQEVRCCYPFCIIDEQDDCEFDAVFIAILILWSLFYNART